MADLKTVDIVVAAIIGIACLRGLFIGLIREAFSLVSLGAAYLAIRAFVGPVAEWLQAIGEGRIGAAVAPWLAGALIAVASVALVTLVGRAVWRGARAAGLGLADRMGGGLLGATEGLLIVALAVVLVGDRIGRDHPAIAQSWTLAAIERLESVTGAAPIGDVDVASPPRSR